MTSEALTLPALLESLLFVAPGPVTVAQLAQATEAPLEAVEEGLLRLDEALRERGIQLQRVGERVRLTTAPGGARAVQRLLGLGEEQALTPAVLETLAIIAYHQPVTKPHIEAIRGVGADHAVRALLARGLIEEAGRGEGVGRPILYRPTARFLEHFGLPSLDSLPPLDEEHGD